MKIVLLAHTRIGSDFVVGSHHLYRCFKKSGHDVLHFSSPISLLHLFNLHKKEIRTRLKIALKQILSKKSISDNYIPICIFPANYIAEYFPAIFKKILSYPFGLKSIVLRELHQSEIDLLIVDHPLWVGCDSIIFARKTIYRPTDIYTDFDQSLRRLEEKILESSNTVIATSLPTKQHIDAYEKNLIVHLIRNGVDLTAWGNESKEPPDIKGIPHPRAIYVGALDMRFDFEIIEEAALSEPLISFILIGPIENIQKNKKLPNLYYLGSRPHAEISAYMDHCDIALLTTNDHPANHGRSPMKIYEYAASGLGVIAKKTAELSSREDTGFVYLYEGLSDFKCLLASSIKNKDHTRETALASAKAMSWEYIAEKILKISSASKEI